MSYNALPYDIQSRALQKHPGELSMTAVECSRFGDRDIDNIVRRLQSAFSRFQQAVESSYGVACDVERHAGNVVNTLDGVIYGGSSNIPKSQARLLAERTQRQTNNAENIRNVFRGIEATLTSIQEDIRRKQNKLSRSDGLLGLLQRIGSAISGLARMAASAMSFFSGRASSRTTALQAIYSPPRSSGWLFGGSSKTQAKREFLNTLDNGISNSIRQVEQIGDWWSDEHSALSSLQQSGKKSLAKGKVNRNEAVRMRQDWRAVGRSASEYADEVESAMDTRRRVGGGLRAFGSLGF